MMGSILFCLVCFFLHPIHYPRITLALPPSVLRSSNSDPGPLLLPPRDGTCLLSHRVNNSAFTFLVNPRRIVPTHAARRSQQQLILFMLHFLQI